MTIKEMRKQTGLTQTQFADKLCIPHGTIKNWEQNRRQTPSYLESLIQEVLISRGYVFPEHPKDTTKEIRQSVFPIAKKYKIKRLVLFGSRARGDYDGKSDYDFLLSRGEIKSYLQLAGLREELESALSAKVDIVTDDAADDYILHDAAKEGVIVYES